MIVASVCTIMVWAVEFADGYSMAVVRQLASQGKGSLLVAMWLSLLPLSRAAQCSQQSHTFELSLG